MLKQHRITTILALVAALVAAPILTPAAAEAAPRKATTTATQRATAATVALSKVRAPYRWGATGPGSFDCSGLATYAYGRAGHKLAERTSQALHRTGTRIRRGSLRPGDLVWTWDRKLGHMGIYVGRGRYVHAPGKGRRVQVSPLPGGRGLVSAIRP